MCLSKGLNRIVSGHQRDRHAEQKATRTIRAEFTKHMMDVSNAEFRVMHDICYVSGSIGIMRGGPPDPRKASEKLADTLVAKRLVKDVIFYNSWRTA